MRIAASGVVAVAVLAGLAAPAEQEVQQRPPFRATTRLVEVSVVVRDRDGRPVQGLTAADFKISEEGKPQTIELFTVQDDRAGSTADPAPAAPRTARPSADRADFSNVGARRAGSVTAILVDRVNSVDIDQKAARDQLVKFLEQVRREDVVALYVLETGSIRVLHDFTTDTS